MYVSYGYKKVKENQMTRTSAHQARYKIDNMTTNDTMYKLIDRIYNDFEKRICKNCDFFSKIGSCENKESIVYNQITVDDFGCTEFELKYES